MKSIPEFVAFNKELLRKERRMKESMKVDKITETLECDYCGNDITDFENDLFHITAIINWKLNSHVHLCSKCFSSNINHIPVFPLKG